MNDSEVKIIRELFQPKTFIFGDSRAYHNLDHNLIYNKFSYELQSRVFNEQTAVDLFIAQMKEFLAQLEFDYIILRSVSVDTHVDDENSITKASTRFCPNINPKTFETKSNLFHLYTQQGKAIKLLRDEDES